MFNRNATGRRTLGLNQRGISLTEAILGVATLGVGLGVIADLQVENLRKVRAETASQQMQVVFNAAQAAVRDYYGEIIAGCGGAAPPADCSSAVINATPNGATTVIPVELLEENNYIDTRLLAAGAIRPNAFNQNYVISVTNIGPAPNGGGDRLRVQVVTQGGQEIDEISGAQIAASIGNEGGFRPPDGGGAIYADDTMYGAYGNWQLSQADMGGAGTAPTDGGLAAVAYFGEGGVTADFLYRNSVPGQPQAQQMNANIDLNTFGLSNVRQIGGEDVGAGVNSNPQVNPSNINPDPITTTFLTGARVDTDGDGILEDNTTGGTVDNVIRFGNAQAGLSGVAYDRGNANIVGNDMVMGIVDAEEAVRAQRQIAAVNRANTAGQRVLLDSGIDVATGQPQVGVGGGVDDEPFGLLSFDDLNRERTRIVTDRELGPGETGTIALGDNTAVLGSRRVELDYGRDAANAVDGTAGNITLRGSVPAEPARMQTSYAGTNGTANSRGVIFFNDGAQERLRVEYGVERDGDISPTVGTFTMADNAGGQRAAIEYNLNRAGTGPIAGSGNLVMRDAGGNERLRSEFGLNVAGTGADASRGVVNVLDETGAVRGSQQYTAAAVGNIALRDRANQGAGAERFIADINGAAGNVILRDNAANQRSINTYDGAAGQIAISDAAQVRVQAQYGTDSVGGNNANRGNVSLVDNAGRLRIASEYGRDAAGATGANLGNIRLQDVAGNRRASFDHNATDTNARFADSNGVVRDEFSSTGANAFRRSLDAGSVARYEFQTGAGGAAATMRMRDSANNVRYEFQTAGAGAGAIERVSDSVRSRREFDTATGTQDWRGVNGLERAIIESTNGQFRLSTDNANAIGSGGHFFVDPVTGQIDLGSDTTDTITMSFKGDSTLGSPYDGRIQYNENNNTFGIRTGGQANDTVQIASNADRNVFRVLDQAGNNRVVLRGENLAAQPSLIVNNAAGNNRMRFFTESATADGALKIGGGGLIGASPLGADQSYMDVDDIYLRGRNTWLSQTFLENQLIVAGIEVLQDNQVVNNTITQRCTAPSAGPGGTVLFSATPAWWVSPVMIAQTRITQQLLNSVDDVVTVTDVDDLNPSNGAELNNTGYDNNTQGRVYMAGNRLIMEARQRNDLTWRRMTGGTAIVTVYCDLP